EDARRGIGFDVGHRSLPRENGWRQPTEIGVPAKAGTHFSEALAAKGWVPTFAGTTVWRLFRRDDHRHLAAFHAWELLDLGDLVEIALDPHQDVHPQFLMRQFPTAEPHRHLDLVTFLDELGHAPHFDVIVMVVDARAELDFLDFDNFLLLA